MRFAVLTSYVIGAAFFAMIGARYARRMNRNWLAGAIVLAALLFALASYTFFVGW